jgi:hypothetical protein
MPMSDTEQVVERFVERTATLFREIEEWSLRTDLSVRRHDHHLPVDYGDVETGALELRRQGVLIADFVPASAYVIAAKGRVDVRGRLDRAKLLYFEAEPRSEAIVTDQAGKIVMSQSIAVFSGVREPGWYLIGDSHRREARIFDERAFFDTLAEISDYEPAQ